MNIRRDDELSHRKSVRDHLSQSQANFNTKKFFGYNPIAFKDVNNRKTHGSMTQQYGLFSGKNNDIGKDSLHSYRSYRSDGNRSV